MEFAKTTPDCADVYGRGGGLSDFENLVSSFLGKPGGLFFATGTCANQAAVRAACQVRLESAYVCEACLRV
jgi:threonine aldolase